MPNTIAAENDCPVQVRAELVSLGGAILLGICLIITALFVMAMSTPTTTGLQRIIAVVLFVSLWVYSFNSITERLALVGNDLMFTAVLSVKRKIPLRELESMVLTHEGFNLERGIVTIELRSTGHKPEYLALGPCWQQGKLEVFMQSVQKAMRTSASLQTFS